MKHTLTTMQLRLFNPIKVDARKGAKLYITTSKGVVDFYEYSTETELVGNDLFVLTLPRWAVVRFGLWHLVRKN
jgi:hypothetical protein